ncbi:MAG: PP0621 family protein [Burkholderiales bacterium]
MKYIIVLLVILVVVWLARSGSRRVTRTDRSKTPLPPHEDMVACSQCGLHMPRSEALPGRGGHFCSDVHRAEFERAHE